MYRRATSQKKNDLAETLRVLLHRYEISPKRLQIEVTETAVMIDNARSVEALTALRSLGVTVAIDDFGVGHSSLAYLAALPANTIKIDRALIARIIEQPATIGSRAVRSPSAMIWG
jgi:diguanylate cyclase